MSEYVAETDHVQSSRQNFGSDIQEFYKNFVSGWA
jgi:hypothetical protein